MTIQSPPQYRYSFFDPWDKQAYELIKKLAQSKEYPKILGTRDDKNIFLVTLIRTQKALHGWRKFLIDIIAQVKSNGIIDTIELIKKYPPESIAKDTPAWVTYKEDEIVSNFIDELATKKIDFVGTNEEISEFVLRFTLGQLGHDWEWTIMMIWEMLGNKDKLYINKLNKEMKNFDHSKLFE